MSKTKIKFADQIPDPWILPLPSIGLNKALNGGLLSGRIHCFYGPKASGKSTLAYHAIGEAQRMGKVCKYVDAENTFLKSRAAACGVDLSQLRMNFDQKAEEILTDVIPEIKTGEVNVLVIDSINSVFFDAYFNDPTYKGIGTGARSQNLVVSKILEALDPFDTQIILICHVTMAQSGQTMTQQAKLSESTKHWCASQIKLRKDMSKQELNDEHSKIYWTVEKSKWSNYPKDGYYTLYSDDKVYIDTYGELAHVAIELELLKKGGAWYTYVDRNGEERKFQGEGGLAKALKEDDDFYKEIFDQV